MSASWSQIILARLAVDPPLFSEGRIAIAHLLIYHGKPIRLSPALESDFHFWFATATTQPIPYTNNVHHQKASDLEFTIQAYGQRLLENVTGANTRARTTRRH